MCCARVANGRHCRKNGSAAPVLSTNTSGNGSAKGCSFDFGGKGWLNTTTWRGSPGLGKASTGRWSRRPWRRKQSARTQPIGEKKGSKRSLLVDGIGIPLSIVASGAQVHDVKLLEPTLDQIVTERPPAQLPPKENLCADAGYAGQPAKQAIEERNYVPHIRPRGEETESNRRNPRKRARRWVVERTHSWLNRYRKLLVRFEKTALSFEGLLELACALIVFRHVINIYG
jgi:transposase